MKLINRGPVDHLTGVSVDPEAGLGAVPGPAFSLR